MVGDNLAGTSSHDDMVRSALANKLCDDEYVIFLAVKDMKEAVGISEKLSSSCLESSDYEKIRIATTEEKSKWDSVLGMIKLGPSFKSVDSPFRPVVKVVALIAA